MASKKKKNTKPQKNNFHFWIKGPLNYNLLFAIIFLNIFGLIMMYSASYYSAANLNLATYHFLKSQFTYVLIGFFGMWFVSKINYHFWMKLGWVGLGTSAVFIALLKTPLGFGALGAVRWLNFGVIKFQAAEPVKLLMMVFFAMYVSEHDMEKIAFKWSTGKEFIFKRVPFAEMIFTKIPIGKIPFRHIMLNWIPFKWIPFPNIAFQGMPNRWIAGICAFIIAGMIAVISNNVSTAVIVLGVCVVILAASQKNLRFYVWLIVVGSIAIAAFLGTIEFLIPASTEENFRITRIRAFMHPEDYMSSTSVQPMQALYAIGAGGFWGKGLGQSLVKFKLAEPYNDYILAIICEELGVFGVCMLLFLFGYLLVQIVKIERIACDIEGKIFCIGVFAQVAIQTILNVMVVSGLFPTTGVSLPFISYGGASAIFLLVEFGVVFNIDSYAKNKKYRREAVKEVDEQEKKRLQELLVK